MPHPFTTFNYAQVVFMDIDSLEIDDMGKEWIVNALAEISGYVWTSDFQPRIPQAYNSPSDRAVHLMFESRYRDSSMALTRHLFSAVGRLYHELGHYFDLTRTYMGYEMFFYGSGVLIDAAYVLEYAAFYEHAPMDFCRLLRRGEYSRIVGEKPGEPFDKFIRLHWVFSTEHNAVYGNLTQQRLFGYPHTQSTIWEFSALLREISAILHLFGEYPFELYCDELLNLYNTSSAILLWNELLSGLNRRQIAIRSEEGLEAIAGCNLLINLSLNGTTSADKELGEGPDYLECFFTYFYEWLDERDLNRETAVGRVRHINSEVGYLAPEQTYEFLSEYVEAHRKSAGFKRTKDAGKASDNDFGEGMLGRVGGYIRSTEEKYVEVFREYRDSIRGLLSVYDFVYWPQIEWIPVVSRFRSRVAVLGHRYQDREHGMGMLEVFEMALLSNYLLFEEKVAHPAFYESLEEGAFKGIDPQKNPFF